MSKVNFKISRFIPPWRSSFHAKTGAYPGRPAPTVLRLAARGKGEQRRLGTGVGAQQGACGLVASVYFPEVERVTTVWS